MMEEVTKHYLISGRVQGVGYRAFTQRTAVSIGLKGWVRNLWDGRVEAVARGEASRLQAFESQLKTGPQRSIVDSLLVRELKASALTSGDFAIREDGREPCSDV